MDNSQKERLRKAIQKRIQELKSDIRGYEDVTAPVAPDAAIGRLTRMDAIQNKSVAEAALKKARRDLDRLMDALGNMEQEDFGLCAECEEPIPIKRLLIMPEADLCVACAEKFGG